MKRVLIIASVASMIDQFNMQNIKLLQEIGFSVDVACNFQNGNTCSKERVEKLKQALQDMGVLYYQIDFARNILHVGKNIMAFRQTDRLLKENNYAFLHCHSPIGGVVGRLAGKKHKVKVLYTAHGFHFYQGAPLKNWLIFYPIEKICSFMTEVLVCINQEDYILAQKKMRAKKVCYVPGIGLDLDRFQTIRQTGQAMESRQKLRESIGIAKHEVLFLSVGELNKNKNHAAVIQALGKLKQDYSVSNFRYAIAGKGKLEAKLKKQAVDCSIADQVHFLGFREDIVDWYLAADAFVLPSYREGLSVSLMEAMASGLPCAVSDIRGNTDLIDEGKGGICYSPFKQEQVCRALKHILQSTPEERALWGGYNQNKIRSFDTKQVNQAMKVIYTDFYL